MRNEETYRMVWAAAYALEYDREINKDCATSDAYDAHKRNAVTEALAAADMAVRHLREYDAGS